MKKLNWHNIKVFTISFAIVYSYGILMSGNQNDATALLRLILANIQAMPVIRFIFLTLIRNKYN